MPGPTAIHDLPQLTWLGVKAYASDIRTSWQHRLPEYEYAYVDGEAHDNTGRKSLRVACTLHFLNTIEPGLYPGKWNSFRGLLLSTQSGTLAHPEIGKFNARVSDGEYTISGRSPAGVSVAVSWVESIKNSQSTTKFTTQNAPAAQSARDLDDAMAALGFDYPDGMGSGSTFAGLVGDIMSIGTTYTNEAKSLVNKTIGFSDAVYEQMQIAAASVANAGAAVRDAVAAPPFRWLLEVSCDALRVALLEHLQALAEGAQPIKTHTTSHNTTLAALSLELDADIGGLIQLNPALVASPSVNKNTTVLYFAA